MISFDVNIFQLISLCIFCYIAYLLRSFVKLFYIPQVEEDYLDEAEVARLQREEEFNLRIAKLKEELAQTMHPDKVTRTSGNVAEELHPMVKNLPHDSVRVMTSVPDEEYAR